METLWSMTAILRSGMKPVQSDSETLRPLDVLERGKKVFHGDSRLPEYSGQSTDFDLLVNGNNTTNSSAAKNHVASTLS
jgi:hypothetical protein